MISLVGRVVGRLIWETLQGPSRHPLYNGQSLTDVQQFAGGRVDKLGNGIAGSCGGNATSAASLPPTPKARWAHLGWVRRYAAYSEDNIGSFKGNIRGVSSGHIRLEGLVRSKLLYQEVCSRRTTESGQRTGRAWFGPSLE